MSLDYTFTSPLPNGVHARPASAIEEVSRRFTSAVSLENCRTGQAANAKSVLGIVGLDIRQGDPCRLTIDGGDEREARAALEAFFDDVFPRCDAPLPVVEAHGAEVALPRVLAEAHAEVLPGQAVVPGIGEGIAVQADAFVVPAAIALQGPADPRAEVAACEAALERLVVRLDASLAGAARGIEADLLRAHRSVVRDPEFRHHLRGAILERGLTAAGAISSAEHTFTAMLAATGSALLRERALDIRDVCVQLLREIYGSAVGGNDIVLEADSVCLADVLTPGQFLALDARRLKGLVLAHGGTTSHTVILARSRGVPTLVGVSGLEGADLDGRPVIVDADLGVLVTCVTAPVRRYYDLERKRLEGRRLRERFFAGRPGATKDGRRVEIAANIATSEEAAPAIAAGAEAIGLFRTEMLFVDRDAAPDEEEQFEAYRRAVADAAGRPVIIRTLDVGGDKPLPYLKLPREDNPFLGYRAVRLYPEFEPLFRAQVRALLRASAFGSLRVMIPFVSRVEEATWTRAIVSSERVRLAEEGVKVDPSMQLGAMIEVPSAAFLIDRLSRVLDFFSIGTNDLLQYFTAVDRSNARVDALYTASSPAFVGLLRKIVDEAHAQDRWVGMCGEMGGEPRYLPLLVALGLDEISMAAPLVPAAKTELSAIASDSATRLLHDALAASTSAEVDDLLARAASDGSAPLVTPALVSTDGRARTRAEAIKEAVDLLYAAGRTDRPRDVEDAVWRREAVYSTGFGHAFAIPHCRTDAVRTNSLAVLKLRSPVEWGSPGGEPVRVLILLAIREANQAAAHMGVLATLARRLVHDDFRERLEQEQSAEELCEFLEGIGAA
jgi:fructose-specific PTS system IIA-like component